MGHFNGGKTEPEGGCRLLPYLQLFYSCAAAPSLFLSETADFETTLLRRREESEEHKNFPSATLTLTPPLLTQKHSGHNCTFYDSSTKAPHARRAPSVPSYVI